MLMLPCFTFIPKTVMGHYLKQRLLFIVEVQYLIFRDVKMLGEAVQGPCNLLVCSSACLGAV